MPGQVMDPALLPQLSHDGVYPGEARLRFGPLGKRFEIFVPGDADADGVPLHLVEARVVGRRGVEELPPQQLAIQRERRGAVLLHLEKNRRSEKIDRRFQNVEAASFQKIQRDLVSETFRSIKP